jgi:serine protease Do
MRHGICGLTALAVVLLGTDIAQARYNRRTAVVEAVDKTKGAIVTIKIQGSDTDATGTGVIIDERGFILTSRHLLGDSQEARVHLADGTALPARIIAKDAATDLAVLRIQPAKPLQALELGPASDLMVGETVIAVGHPFGYAHSATVGIISALDRKITLPTGETLVGLIQTDAGINPGSSGGPLLNINGELIGINCALREGANGVAFAVNAETAKQVLIHELSSASVGSVSHGLRCLERVSDEGDQRQHIIVAAGADARSGDIQPGDEIITIGARAILNRFDVERAVWDAKPGDRLQVKIKRAGLERMASLDILPARGQASAAAAVAASPSTDSALRGAAHQGR